MRKKWKHSIFLILSGCAACSACLSQKGFRHSAMLNTVPASGFYQVDLLPPLSAALQLNMKDIRIADAAGKEVPYILKSELPAFKENKFIAFPILSVKKEKDGQTHVVIENVLRQSLDELLLIIKNTAAGRSVTLSGSDDNKNWFVIKENIYLNSLFSGPADRFVQALVFPKSNYRYFTIIINGKDILPVNIVQAGIYEQTVHTGKYVQLPVPVLVQKDSSDKHSYLFVKFNNHYFVDRLILQIRAPKFYNRTLEIYTGGIGSEVLQGSFSIRSEKETILTLAVKTNTLLIKINNNDNPPLQIDNIAAFQLNKYLLAYLEKANVYHLVFSDSTATVPVYDLEAFKDSIGSDAIALLYGTILQNDLPVKKITVAESNSKTIIWVAIAAAIAILLLLTSKLTGEIKNKQ